MDHLTLDTCRVDLGRLEVHRDGEVVALTPLEADLLRHLAARPGRTSSRDELLVEVWGFPRPVRTRAVDNTVMRLRLKIEADPKAPRHLQSIRGRGYLLDVESVPSPVVAPPAAAPVDDGPPMIGREDDLAALRAAATESRLVTLAGPMGVGKTRLVRAWIAAFGTAHRTVWCPLAPARAREPMLRAIAAALGASTSAPDTDALEAQVRAALHAAGSTTLVLDNLE